jgi:hypothetical protein
MEWKMKEQNIINAKKTIKLIGIKSTGNSLIIGLYLISRGP